MNGCPAHARQALTKMARAQVNSDFYRAFSTKNISLMGTVWHKSPHVQCIHPGAKPLVGYDNIVSMWSNMFQVTCVHAGCARVAFALAHRREDHAHHRRCMKRSAVLFCSVARRA